MHPRQASVLEQATEVAKRTAGKQAEVQKDAEVDKEALSNGGQALLWKYTDPEGGVFYLEQKRMTGIKSPFNGKTFTPKPTRHTPAQVGKEMRQDDGPATAAGGSGEKNASGVPAEFWKA